MSQAIIPVPSANVVVRPATIDDLPFIDSLQKMHRKQIGFLKLPAIVGKIAKGEILVAEERLTADYTDGTDKSDGLNSSVVSALSVVPTRLGYVMGADRYFKHDDVGIIYQLNVVPGKQRGFIGATLLKAMFDHAAYGCKLFCCWCAQDIAANKFWEAMGFVPLAFRAGSEKKRRVHIFWQKRIREGDTTTPWWFPSETSGGSMGENRLALPIPPGKHWSDEMPVILPALSNVEGPEEGKMLEQEHAEVAEKRKRIGSSASSAASCSKSSVKQPKVLTTAAIGMRFLSTELKAGGPAEPEKVEKPKREKKPKRKNDPKLVAAAREFKDRWLEHVNAGEMLIEGAGKYDVCRGAIAGREWVGQFVDGQVVKQLPNVAA